MRDTKQSISSPPSSRTESGDRGTRLVATPAGDRDNKKFNRRNRELSVCQMPRWRAIKPGSYQPMLQDIRRPISSSWSLWKGPIACAAIFAFACVYATTIAEVRAANAEKPATLEKWGTVEVELPGPTDGNPFIDVEI